MAVEMPGSTDMSGLNLQFGAFQFGSEPAMPEYESTPASTTQVHQVQNSLYTSPSSQMDMYDQRASQTRRYPPSVSSSPQKDMQPKNGFSSIHGTHSGEAGSAVSVRQVSDSVTPVSMGTLTDSGSGPASLMTSSNQTSLSGLGHSEDMPPNTFPPPQHNNSHQSQQNSLAQSSVRSSNSSLMHPSVDGDSSLHCSNYPSSVSSVPSSVPSSSSAQVSLGVHQACSVGSNTVLAPSGLCPISSLAMGLNPASMAVQAAVAAASMSSAVSAIPSLATSSSSRNSAASSGKAPPNLPPGVPPLLPNPYIMAPGLLHAYPPQVYGYDDLQMLQARIPLDYYSIAPFATPTAALTGRDGNLTNNPYSGDLSKFGRGDASSPSPATTLAQTQQNQTQAHHTAQQPFLNPALPPGYSYTSLPYYTGMPGLPNTFQYGPAVFPVAPTSSKQHGVNVGVNASAAPFQQASGYGSHGYSTGVSVTSSNTGVPDISGSVYTKTQSFDKQGFHAGTPAASFSLPSALGSGGPINPPAATAYAPAPFMHILAPHQQPHSQILHHHLQQDGQSGTGQRSQNASLQQKSQINKSAYNTYNWGAN
ncbi:Ubiquitin-associated protein 2-like [Dissostichus eleginoides]|nr:Ubiquitin-associated protein 2-like [Dissostichus eleginoides]